VVEKLGFRFWGDPSLPAADLATNFVLRLYSAIAESNQFPKDWVDIGWYSKNRGLTPQEVIDISDLDAVAGMIQRSGWEGVTPDNPISSFSPWLESKTAMNYKLIADFPRLPGSVDDVRRLAYASLVQGWNIGGEDDTETKALDPQTVVSILARLVDDLPLASAYYDLESNRERADQVSQPKTALEIIRVSKIRSPARIGYVGWVTYLSDKYWPVEEHLLGLPSDIEVTRARGGYFLQIGSSPLAVTDRDIARLRKAIGWEHHPIDQ
jgi:hypothetical protein